MNKEILMGIMNSPKNLIVNGDLASGKTRDFLFPYVEQVLAKKESLFIVDSKEEYLKYFLNKVKNEYNIIVINLRNPNLSEGFNPLEQPYRLYQNGSIDQSIEMLENICNTIFYDTNSVDSFWTNSATSYVMGIILKLFFKEGNNKINLKSVANEVEILESLDLEDKKKYFGESDSIAYCYASPIICAPNETRGGIISVVRQKLNSYINKVNINKLLTTSTFSFNKINHNPSIIFFITRDEETKNNGIASMLISELFNYLIKDNQRKFNFLVDNYDDLPIINNLKELLSSGPSHNIKFILATRDKDILEERYSKYLYKLCDVISIGKKIKVTVNDETNKYEKEQELEEKEEEPDEETDYFEIDINDYDFDLEIKEIENKINDLEKKEEKIKNEINLEYIESELEQFKI